MLYVQGRLSLWALVCRPSGLELDPGSTLNSASLQLLHSTGEVPSDFQAPPQLTEPECVRQCSLVFPDAPWLFSDLFLLKTPQRTYGILRIVWSAPGFSLKACVLRNPSVSQQRPKIQQSKIKDLVPSTRHFSPSALFCVLRLPGGGFFFFFCCFWFWVLSKCWLPGLASRDSEVKLLVSF